MYVNHHPIYYMNVLTNVQSMIMYIYPAGATGQPTSRGAVVLLYSMVYIYPSPSPGSGPGSGSGVGVSVSGVLPTEPAKLTKPPPGPAAPACQHQHHQHHQHRQYWCMHGAFASESAFFSPEWYIGPAPAPCATPPTPSSAQPCSHVPARTPARRRCV